MKITIMRLRMFILVLCFSFFSGCSAVKLLSVAGKSAKAGATTVKVAKGASTAAKAGKATAVAGKGAAVTAIAHADDAFRVGRLADDADAFMLVGSELPKASRGVSTFDPSELDVILTGIDLADLVSSTWEIGQYDLGENGPSGMREALESFPSTEALSPVMPAGEEHWVQWVRLPEGDRLSVYGPRDEKVAFLQPQPRD